MRERGDCAVLHEPFLGYFYRRRAGRSLPLHLDEQENMPDTYEGVRAMVLEAGEAGPLFFKGYELLCRTGNSIGSGICKPADQYFSRS